MWSQALVLFGVFLATAGQAVAQDKPSGPTPDQKRLGELIAKAEGPYTKVAEGVWHTSYRGKNMPTINVRVATLEGGVFFFVDLFERKSITLSRNLLLKLAELNSDFDYGKVALSDDSLLIRLDARAKHLDLDEFKALEQQVASVADEAYGIIKDFLP